MTEFKIKKRSNLARTQLKFSENS